MHIFQAAFLNPRTCILGILRHPRHFSGEVGTFFLDVSGNLKQVSSIPRVRAFPVTSEADFLLCAKQENFDVVSKNPSILGNNSFTVAIDLRQHRTDSLRYSISGVLFLGEDVLGTVPMDFEAP